MHRLTHRLCAQRGRAGEKALQAPLSGEGEGGGGGGEARGGGSGGADGGIDRGGGGHERSGGERGAAARRTGKRGFIHPLGPRHLH